MEITRYERAKPVQALPGLVRRVLTYSPTLMLVENRIDAGTLLPLHHHPHEQILYVQSGELTLNCQGQEQRMRTGDSCTIPGHTPHSVLAQTDLIAIDIFTPARQDFI